MRPKRLATVLPCLRFTRMRCTAPSPTTFTTAAQQVKPLPACLQSPAHQSAAPPFLPTRSASLKAARLAAFLLSPADATSEPARPARQSASVSRRISRRTEPKLHPIAADRQYKS